MEHRPSPAAPLNKRVMKWSLRRVRELCGAYFLFLPNSEKNSGSLGRISKHHHLSAGSPGGANTVISAVS